MKRYLIVDGNNQFFINYARAINYDDLVRRCLEMHRGFDGVFWTFDGYDSRKLRRDLLPSYKDTASRAKAKTDTGKYDMLRKFKLEDLPEHGGVCIIERPQTEADDLIRKLAMILHRDDVYIEIASNDVDLLSLSYLKNVKQPQAKLPEDVKTSWELNLYKTLVGDSSDNIKGLKGFGSKAWEKLNQDQRKYLHDCFTNEMPIYQNDINVFPTFEKREIKLVDTLTECWDALTICWKVVNFIDIPDDEVMKYLKSYPAKAKVDSKPKIITMD